MKIGICNTAFFSDELDAVDYRKMSECGFNCGDYQQLSSIRDNLYTISDSEFVKVLTEEREKAKENGITFSQVHAPFFPEGDLDETRPLLMEYTKKAVRGTQILGCKNLVVHTLHPYRYGEDGDQDKSYTVNFEYFRELSAYAAERNVSICVENLPFVNRRLSHTPELVKFVDELNLPNLSICFDTGHSNICGEDIKDMLLLCGSRIKAFHIHDNRGRKNGDIHILPYTGTIDWKRFEEGIKEIRFDGCLSLEAEVKRNCPWPIRKRMMACLSEMLRGMRDE